jgi:dienelactone hydrolase
MTLRRHRTSFAATVLLVAATSACVVEGDDALGPDAGVDEPGDEALDGEGDVDALALADLFAGAKAVHIDLGRDRAVPASWNDAQALVRSGSIALKTADGVATSMRFGIAEPWNIDQPYGTTVASTIGLPLAATADGLYGNVGAYGGFAAPRAAMNVTGLSPSTTYTFRFFAPIKKGDTLRRDTTYKVIGATTTSGTLDPTNNDQRYLTLTVQPNASGNVRVEVTAAAGNNTSAGFYHLSNLSFVAATVPPPPPPSGAYGVQRAIAITSTTYGEAPPNGYQEYLPAAYAGSGSQTWPVIIALHGIGEVGSGSATDLAKLVRSGVGLAAIIKGGTFKAHDKFIVLSPQTPNYLYPSEIRAFLQYAQRHYRIDPRRMYLTGLSYGGRQAWDYVNDFGATSEFAAMAVAPGDGAYDTLNCAKAGRTPIWQFQGDVDTDDYTNLPHAVAAWTKINGCATPPIERSRLTVYTGLGHYVWGPTYSLSGMTRATDARYDRYSEGVFDWFLRHRKP